MTWADPLRIATFNTELHRDGPGLLLRDITRGEDAQVKAVLSALIAAEADVVVLQNIDHDLHNTALNALADALKQQGLSYPVRFALRPNTGIQSGFDLDGNGRQDEARDAHGYGEFSGQSGMAILSRWPIETAEVQDFTDLRWQALPGALLPQHPDGSPFPTAEASAAARLSTTGHWVVPIDPPDAPRFWVMTFHATPPVFDGPEDRNGKRNHDEVAFWTVYLNGGFAAPLSQRFGAPLSQRFVIAGDANADPVKGDGIKSAIRNLLDDPRLQDPLKGLQTVDWPDPGPGLMRVDYVLPSVDWRVVDKGRISAPKASRHSLVWIDLE